MRLIDIDALRVTDGINEDGVLYIPLRDVASAPTIELTFCKDCKKWYASGAICEWWYCKTDSYFYCGDAEPRKVTIKGD